LAHDSSLEPALRAVEPALRLVSERRLRRVLQFLADRGHPLPTNTDEPYWISREDLAACDFLPPDLRAETEPEVLLVTDPDDRLIRRLPVEQQLRVYWRVLFRAAVMRAIDRKALAGTLTEESCLRRLGGFGQPAAREIRSVLLAEHLIVPEANSVARYRAFAATVLDLEAFDPHAVGHFFPSLPPGEEVGRVLAEDVDAAALLAGCRPSGAAETAREPRTEETPDDPGTVREGAAEVEPTGLLRKAREVEEKGNNVRAAILRTVGASRLEGEERESAMRGAHAALGRFVDALGDVFLWDGNTRQEWRQALASLLEPAARGTCPRAARCLYELQKIPADLSREVYAVDLPEAVRTFGRRPVKRHLPHARPVLILMSLKKAHAQLLRAGLDRAAQARLDRVFHYQIHAVEYSVRREFTPIIGGALASAGLSPTNTVEEVARDKLVAELLDRICERGYLRIGNLRDAVARNRLKMQDLTGVGEFFRGDALLRADVTLAYALDGVYRRGEFYLRWIQRASAVFFGTALGRLFTLYLAVPFGGAFMTLMFVEELRHMGGKLGSLLSRPPATAKAVPAPAPSGPAGEAQAAREVISPDQLDVGEDGQVVWVDPAEEGNPLLFGTEPGAALVTDVFTSSAPAAPHAEHHASFLVAWPTILGFGVFLLLMVHVPPFRRGVLLILAYLWWALRGALWDLPVAVWRSRTVRGLRQSLPVRFLVRHFWSPLLLTLLLFSTMLLVGVSPWFLFRWGVWIWAGLTVTYNTPWGWVVQDRLAEAVSDWWRLVRVNLIPGLIATIIDWFKSLANWVERQLYAVDEWLRFRGGDSRGSLAVKAVLGLLWFPVAYTFRFVFYLLVEPQVNPVKHFPVVTVSHKVIWPTLPMLAETTGLSQWTVAAFLNGIPGIFGFIAWELKENWKLYGANRPRRLRPVTIGSHGESMRGLLRPGFHSGTVPKIFRKLRHAGRRKAFRLHHELEHGTEAVRRFAERELVAVLGRSPEWRNVRIEVAAVRFGCQRVVIELAAPGLGRDPFTLAFENVGGVIEAGVEEYGWADNVSEPRRGAFVAALRGFLDMAAADRVEGRERVEDPAPSGPGFADLARRTTLAEWVERWHVPVDGPREIEPGPHKLASAGAP
jgi:hypothetical protein